MCLCSTVVKRSLEVKQMRWDFAFRRVAFSFWSDTVLCFVCLELGIRNYSPSSDSLFARLRRLIHDMMMADGRS